MSSRLATTQYTTRFLQHNCIAKVERKSSRLSAVPKRNVMFSVTLARRIRLNKWVVFDGKQEFSLVVISFGQEDKLLFSRALNWVSKHKVKKVIRLKNHMVEVSIRLRCSSKFYTKRSHHSIYFRSSGWTLRFCCRPEAFLESHQIEGANHLEKFPTLREKALRITHITKTTKSLKSHDTLFFVKIILSFLLSLIWV